MPGRVVVALLLAGLLASPPAGFAQAPPITPAPPASPSGSGATAPAVSDRFGIDLASAANPAGAPVQPSTASLLGAGWVRLTANWDALEPARGRFVWTALDAAIRAAAAQNERIVVTIQRTPRWAALTPQAPETVWSHEPPSATADWAAFVRVLASRYRSRVRAWQIEPALEFDVFRGTTRDYLDMLHAARLVVRQADPEALVVAAAPAGLDLPFMKLLFTRAGGDFDALMLYPYGRTARDLIEGLGTLERLGIVDGRHEIWLDAWSNWPHPVQLAVAGLAMGVRREFWNAFTSPLIAVLRVLGNARFVGPLDRGAGVYALVFAANAMRTAIIWTDGAAETVRLATDGTAVVTGLDGQPRTVSASGAVPVGPDPVFVATPSDPVIEEASKALAAGPVAVPRDPAHDYSEADHVSAVLGATNVERGLYNQMLRSLPSGAVVPVTVDGVSAVRTDQQRDAVYVYFAIDDSYAYFVDGRYDYLITVDVHRAAASHRVGFNLMYDSMSGYRFSPWQWVDGGAGWGSYTIRISDASFSKTWGWDFAVNGAGDKQENLVVRRVTVTRVLATQADR